MDCSAVSLSYRNLKKITTTSDAISSVRTWVARLGTAVPPGHDPGQLVAAHEGSAGVSLAGVLAASVQPGADHGVRDVGLAVGVPAGGVRHHGDGHLGLETVRMRRRQKGEGADSDLLEGPAETAALSSGAPSGDDAVGASLVLLHAGGEADPRNVGAKGRLAVQLQHADVVLHGVGVVVLVQLHVLHGEGHLVRVVLVEHVAANLGERELSSALSSA